MLALKTERMRMILKWICENTYWSKLAKECSVWILVVMNFLVLLLEIWLNSYFIYWVGVIVWADQ